METKELAGQNMPKHLPTVIPIIITPGCRDNADSGSLDKSAQYIIKQKGMKMKNRNEMSATILANVEVFDYLKEKVGERKTRTEAYCDLLDKALAGFVSPFLRKQDYELQSCQCHVTISDLAAEWHWHRATVRSFLDTLESLGQLERIRLTKSVIITMSLQTAHSSKDNDVQNQTDLAMQLREALSDWITGKASAEDTGKACGQLVRRALADIGLQDIYPPDDMHVNLSMSARHDEKGWIFARRHWRISHWQPCSACFASRGSMIVWIFSISSASTLVGTGQDSSRPRKNL